jgi:hypothetical protein
MDMSKTKTTIFGLSVSFLLIGPGLADPVDIPNQFQAGTPAVADEVNQNFSAVEAAIDDNAADIGALQSSVDQVLVAGVAVGRFNGVEPPSVVVDLPLGAGTVVVAEAVGGLSGGTVGVISPMGYLFNISSSNFTNPLSQEGEVARLVLTFDLIDCNGNRFFPVEGNTGVFSTFVLGSGFIRPLVRWGARQGFVFASPSPADPNQVYFLRRDAAVTTVTLRSVQFIDSTTLLPACLNFSLLGWDLDPLLADNTVVPVEVNDPAVTGVNGILGGDISIGF